MAKHTPGRLSVTRAPVGRAPLTQVVAEDDRLIADTDRLWRSHETNEANAARLAACWNACLSLDDAALALLPTVLGSYQHAVESRDRLLAAAKNAHALLRRLGGHNHDPEFSELAEAIAFTETTRPEKEGES